MSKPNKGIIPYTPQLPRLDKIQLEELGIRIETVSHRESERLISDFDWFKVQNRDDSPSDSLDGLLVIGRNCVDPRFFTGQYRPDAIGSLMWQASDKPYDRPDEFKSDTPIQFSLACILLAQRDGMTIQPIGVGVYSSFANLTSLESWRDSETIGIYVDFRGKPTIAREEVHRVMECEGFPIRHNGAEIEIYDGFKTFSMDVLYNLNDFCQSHHLRASLVGVTSKRSEGIGLAQNFTIYPLGELHVQYAGGFESRDTYVQFNGKEQINAWIGFAYTAFKNSKK